MPSSGPIRWKDLKPHLDRLLPEWYLRVTTHSRFLYCRSIRRDRFSLPRGAHGSRNPEIRRGDLKQMLKFFGKLEEGQRRIPQLGGGSGSRAARKGGTTE